MSRNLEDITQEALEAAPLEKGGILYLFAKYLAEELELALKKTRPSEALPTIYDLAQKYKLDIRPIQKKIFTKEQFKNAINCSLNFAIFYENINEQELEYVVKSSNDYDRDLILYIHTAPKNKAYYEKVYLKMNYLYGFSQDYKNNMLRNLFKADYASADYFKYFLEMKDKNSFEFLRDESLNDRAEYRQLAIEQPSVINYKSGLLKDVSFIDKFLSEVSISSLVNKNGNNISSYIPVEIMSLVEDEKSIEKVLHTNYSKFPEIESKKWQTRENLLLYLQYTELPNKKIYSFLQNLSKKYPYIKTEKFYLEFLNFKVVNRNEQISQNNLKKILNTNFWTKHFEKIDNMAPYIKFLSERGQSNYYPVPVTALAHIKELIKLCEDYPNVKLEERVKETAIYNKNFALYYLKKQTDKVGNQDLNVLRHVLPDCATKFFESVDIRNNCYDFMVSYFEKKNLQHVLTPVRDRLEIEFEGKFISKNYQVKIIKSEPEISPKETKRFKI